MGDQVHWSEAFNRTSGATGWSDCDLEHHPLFSVKEIQVALHDQDGHADVRDVLVGLCERHGLPKRQHKVFIGGPFRTSKQKTNYDFLDGGLLKIIGGDWGPWPPRGTYVQGFFALRWVLQELGYAPPRRLKGEARVPSRERLTELVEGRIKEPPVPVGEGNAAASAEDAGRSSLLSGTNVKERLKAGDHLDDVVEELCIGDHVQVHAPCDHNERFLYLGGIVTEEYGDLYVVETAEGTGVFERSEIHLLEDAYSPFIKELEQASWWSDVCKEREKALADRGRATKNKFTLPQEHMPEAEVCLRLAFHLLDLAESDGIAEVNLCEEVVEREDPPRPLDWMLSVARYERFPIAEFLEQLGWKRIEGSPGNLWEGMHEKDGKRLRIDVTPSYSRVIARRGAERMYAICAGGHYRSRRELGERLDVPDNRSGTEILERLLQQAIALEEAVEGDVLVAAVPRPYETDQRTKHGSSWETAMATPLLKVALVGRDGFEAVEVLNTVKPVQKIPSPEEVALDRKRYLERKRKAEEAKAREAKTREAKAREAREPAWSPDGTRIAFVKGYDICLMDADGSNLTRLCKGQEREWFPHEGSKPAWSPDGAKIAFSYRQKQRRGGSPPHIYVMNADGSERVRLCHGNSPAWSPDGTRIAYAEYDKWSNSQIHVIDVDGSNQTNISNKRTSHTEPTWSPDGARIAFTNARGRGQIYVMKADGSRQKKLSKDSNLSYKQPAWSPDGARIAFTGSTEQSYFHSWAYGADSGNIYVANADGSNQSQLTSGSSDYGPSWSPDGTKMAFSRVQLIDGVSSRNIYVMDADGSNVTQITGKEE